MGLQLFFRVLQINSLNSRIFQNVNLSWSLRMLFVGLFGDIIFQKKRVNYIVCPLKLVGYYGSLYLTLKITLAPHNWLQHLSLINKMTKMKLCLFLNILISKAFYFSQFMVTKDKLVTNSQTKGTFYAIFNFQSGSGFIFFWTNLNTKRIIY